MKGWIYKLEEDYQTYIPALVGVLFENEWLRVDYGMVTIRVGYSWNGCSPTVSVLGLFNLGVPDGVNRGGKPWTYYASLIHDVLCQYNMDVPITKEESIEAFDYQLKKVEWPLRRLYVRGVRMFGPKKFKLDGVMYEGL